MSSEQDGRAKTLSTLRRMLREIEAGYTPEFIVLLYPHATDDYTDEIVGFNVNDIRKAKILSERFDNMREQIQKQFVLHQLGIEEDEFETVMAKLHEDIDRVAERAFDKFKKDPEVKDTKQAEDLLRELMEKKS